MFVCPDVSPPKPLDQSKNVTVRSYHKLSKDQNEPKKSPKSCQNRQIGKKSPKPPMRHVAKPGEAGRSVVTSLLYNFLSSSDST